MGAFEANSWLCYFKFLESAIFNPRKNSSNTAQSHADAQDTKNFNKMCQFLTMKKKNKKKPDRNCDTVATGILHN